MQTKPITTKIISKNPSLRGDLEGPFGATHGFRFLDSSGGGVPDLIIYDLGEDYENDFDHMETLQTSNPDVEIFLTSRNMSSEMLLRSLRTGAKEFLHQPIETSEVMECITRFLKRRDAKGIDAKIARTIYVIGSKGGVGATTIAVNLAVEIKRSEPALSVALFDMKAVFGDIPIFLGLRPSHHWGEIAENMERLDTTLLKSMLTEHESGLLVLPSPDSIHGKRYSSANALKEILGLLRRTFDILIVDSGQSFDCLLSPLGGQDDLLLIAELNLPCLSNTNHVLATLRKNRIVSIDRVRIIFNRCGKDSELSLQDAREVLGMQPYVTIPNDWKASRTAMNRGKPVLETAPKSAMTKGIQELVPKLMGREGNRTGRGWRLFR